MSAPVAPNLRRSQRTPQLRFAIGALLLFCFASIGARAASAADAVGSAPASSPPSSSARGEIDADSTPSHGATIAPQTYDRQLIGSHATSGANDNSSTSAAPAPDSPTLEAPRVLAALVLVIGLVFGLRWLGRRYFPATVVGRSSAVHLLTRAAITPKQQVLLVRVGRRVLVVADNGSQLSALGQISDSDEVAALVGQVQRDASASAKPFTSLFRKHSQQFEPTDDEVAKTSATERDVFAVDDEETSPAAPKSEAVDVNDVGNVRDELSGLMERVRLVAREFGRGSSASDRT